MRILLAALLCCLPAAGGDVPPQADVQRVKSALAELEAAWKSDSPAERVRALQAQGGVRDAEVVKLVARGLRDKEPDVQRAAIEALRFVAHPDALKELQAQAHDDKALRKDPLLRAALLRAVGQYGQASSIAVLAEEFAAPDDEHVLQARILGLGRVRTREAVEKLLELMKLVGPQRLQMLMPDFRLALLVLTGADQGLSQAAWQSWWSDNRAKWKIAETPLGLPKDLERKWKVYWGEAEDDYRPRKRSERGQPAP